MLSVCIVFSYTLVKVNVMLHSGYKKTSKAERLDVIVYRNAQALSDEQNNWMKASTEKIYQLIKETPPDGEKFAKTVEHILEREEHWNSWKNEGCPDFERKPTDGDGKKLQRRYTGCD